MWKAKAGEATESFSCSAKLQAGNYTNRGQVHQPNQLSGHHIRRADDRRADEESEVGCDNGSYALMSPTKEVASSP